MPRNKENVIIQAPPIEQIGKKRSCLKRTCFTGCGCIVLFLAAMLFLLHTAAGPKEKSIKDLPPRVTNIVPLYDTEAIDKITYTPGSERNKRLEYIAYLPKVILSPIILSLDDSIPEQAQNNSRWQQMKSFIQDPIGDHRDSYTIVWKGLAAKPSFVLDFYKTELQKNGFTISQEFSTTSIQRFEFRKGNINGTVVLTDTVESDGTQMVSVNVFIPTE